MAAARPSAPRPRSQSRPGVAARTRRATSTGTAGPTSSGATRQRARTTCGYMNGGAKIGTAYTPSVGDFNWVIGGIGDFNGDGHPDIWWRNNSTGENYIWFMNNNVQTGTGFAPSVTDFNWSIVGCGDFNGDGKDDVLW